MEVAVLRREVRLLYHAVKRVRARAVASWEAGRIVPEGWGENSPAIYCWDTETINNEAVP